MPDALSIEHPETDKFEMHLYAEGGHAFGLRPTGFPITTEWSKLAEKWLRTIKVP